MENIFFTAQMRSLRTAIVSLNEELERMGLIDCTIEIPEHPKSCLLPQHPANVDDWALKSAIDIDKINIRVRATRRAKKSAKR